MLASAPEGRPRTRPPTTLGAILHGHAQVPDLTFDCNIRARRRRRRRLSGGATQTGRSGSRTGPVCPSPARMAARQSSDPDRPLPRAAAGAQGDGYTWVGEDESYGTDRCSRASYRLSRSCETVGPPRDACRRPEGPPENGSSIRLPRLCSHGRRFQTEATVLVRWYRWPLLSIGEADPTQRGGVIGPGWVSTARVAARGRCDGGPFSASAGLPRAPEN